MESPNIRTLIESLPDPAPNFRIWAQEMRENGRLETFLEAAIQTNQAGNYEQALAFLNSKAKEHEIRHRCVGVCDLFNGDQPHASFTRLTKTLKQNEERKVKTVPWRTIGTISHSAIGDLLSGTLLPKILMPKHPRKQQLFLFDKPTKSLNQSPTTKQLDLFRPNFPPTDARATLSFAQQTALLRLTKEAWREFAAEIKQRNEIWPSAAHTPAGQKFAKNIGRLFGSHYARLKNSRFDNECLNLFAAMSWASAISFCSRQKDFPRILFQEVPVMELRQGLSGGRIDAIEVRKINGRSPTKRQKSILRDMTQQRYKSSGRLLKHLVQIFGPNLEITIIDWKFCVGDAETNQYNDVSLISPQDIKDGPLNNHVLQMQRYLTLAALDYHLLKKGSREQWLESLYFSKGEVVYFLPMQLPTIFELSVSPANRLNFFKQHVAENWRKGEKKAQTRHLSNFLTDILCQLLDNGDDETHSPKKPKYPQLFTEISSRPVAEIVQDMREFVDPGRIIEVTGKDKKGKPKYRMHFGRLLAGIESGEIPIGYFRLPRGGKIKCLFPDHDDSAAPSMHIYPTNASFHCFGCWRHGSIASSSIPENLSIPKAPPGKKVYGMQTRIQKYEATEDHRLIMRRAQEILQSAFWRSPGEHYLTRERCLDPRTGYSLGVGFGDASLIHGLLDFGYTLEQLIFYGFVGVSERVSETGGIMPILKSRNISISSVSCELKRAGFSKKTDVFQGFPYSVLRNRLTFPLSFEGIINSFYGRAIDPNTHQFLKHRKLTVNYTGVPHGGFGTEVLNSPASEIITVEGAIDCLSLIQAGYPNTLAVIGVHNTILWEAIIKSGKDIAIALDNDKGGRKSTARLLWDFRTRRLNTKIRNFTRDFIKRHPEMAQADDYNTWWINRNRKKMRPA